mmetsp:Transcript_104174/g.185036  ORF Transcript_104174/g.185036 Transcript_104174/m.185036 type:complete len:96 (-) Transcript_104174:213-500(-)
MSWTELETKGVIRTSGTAAAGAMAQCFTANIFILTPCKMSQTELALRRNQVTQAVSSHPRLMSSQLYEETDPRYLVTMALVQIAKVNKKLKEHTS